MHCSLRYWETCKHFKMDNDFNCARLSRTPCKCEYNVTINGPYLPSHVTLFTLWERFQTFTSSSSYVNTTRWHSKKIQCISTIIWIVSKFKTNYRMRGVVLKGVKWAGRCGLVALPLTLLDDIVKKIQCTPIWIVSKTVLFFS